MKKPKPPPARSNIVIRNGKIRFREKSNGIVSVSPLSDSDWEKISAHAVLEEKARLDIAVAIWMYRNKTAAERASLTTKRRVIRMRGAIRKLLRDADQLFEDEAFFLAGLPCWSPRTRPNAEDISSRVKSLVELDEILADAQDRMQMKRGRKNSGHLKSLINNLAWIQADVSGTYLKRSTKNGSLRATNPFVTKCIKIADPSISESSIEDALTKCISEHRKTLREYGFNTATGKYEGEGST